MWSYKNNTFSPWYFVEVVSVDDDFTWMFDQGYDLVCPD